MAVSSAAPRSRQTTTPTPNHLIFTGRMLFLTPFQQHQSTEGTDISDTLRTKIKLDKKTDDISKSKLLFLESDSTGQLCGERSLMPIRKILLSGTAAISTFVTRKQVLPGIYFLKIAHCYMCVCHVEAKSS